MHILVSNDDGYLSAGIQALADALRSLADVTVVAPDQERSVSSSSLTVDRPLQVERIEERVYAVDGTPTDCVHLAITGLLKDDAPGMVVSGINHGENLGDDVLYSGTVAAAMEGRFQGLPALAISNVSKHPKHVETAAKVAQGLVRHLLDNPLPNRMILNVNIPDVPADELTGCACTRLGHRHLAKPAIEDKHPHSGALVYWVGAAGAEADAGEGTDFFALSKNQVSVTPLHVDLTHYRVFDQVNDWAQDFDIGRVFD